MKNDLKEVSNPWAYMDRGMYKRYHEVLCKDALDLSMAKNHDYSGGEDGRDPFLNFKTVEHLGIGVTTEQGFMVRLADKMRRLCGFLSTGKFKVKDESFRDTIMDTINYLCLLSAYKESKSPTYTVDLKEGELDGHSYGNRVSKRDESSD